MLRSCGLTPGTLCTVARAPGLQYLFDELIEHGTRGGRLADDLCDCGAPSTQYEEAINLGYLQLSDPPCLDGVASSVLPARLLLQLSPLTSTLEAF